MNIDEHRIREYDDAGHLTRAGFWWRQPIAARDTFVNRVMVTLGFSMILTLPMFWLAYSMKGELARFPVANFLFWTSAPVNLLLLLFFYFLDNSDWCMQKSAIVFSADGSIDGPETLSVFRRKKDQRWFRFREHASEVALIELKPTLTVSGRHYKAPRGYLSYDAWIQFTSGARYIIASEVSESTATIIVAQLGLARGELSAAIKRSVQSRAT
jgi:hypothetical protein